MESFTIEGGHLLKGSITPQGAKNEALQVICATLLTDEEVTIQNIPDILDGRPGRSRYHSKTPDHGRNGLFVGRIKHPHLFKFIF